MNANPPETSPIAQPNPIVRFLRWFFCARTLGRLFFAFLALVTLVALFYLEEHWRGKRAWENYRAGAAVRHQHLDYEYFVPPAVPDEQNFAMTPSLAYLYDFLPGTQTWRDTNAYARNEKAKTITYELSKRKGFDLGSGRFSRWENGERTDLIALLGTNRDAPPSGAATSPATQAEAAAIILDLLHQTFDPTLEELRAASRRPYCRFNVKYDAVPMPAILLPHLATIKSTAQKLSWRADAELVLGRTNEAFADLTLGLYVGDAVKGEPILISHLVRIACRAILTRVIWDGLAAHQWSDAQLQQLEAGLAKDDLMADTERAILAEQAAFAVRTIEQVMARGNKFYLDDVFESKWKCKPLHVLMPTGWLYFEMINMCQFYDRYTTTFNEWRIGQRDTASVLARLTEEGQEFSKQTPLKAVLEHRFLSGLLLPAIGKVAPKSLLAQARIDQTRVACALERYYLANRSYPETLEALAPKFIQKLPADIMTGQPLLYRRETPQSFVLYSVGLNSKDDGGQVVVNKEGGVNVEQGDWVWRQPSP
jgi:hypothetical protein